MSCEHSLHLTAPLDQTMIMARLNFDVILRGQGWREIRGISVRRHYGDVEKNKGPAERSIHSGAGPIINLCTNHLRLKYRSCLTPCDMRPDVPTSKPLLMICHHFIVIILPSDVPGEEGSYLGWYLGIRVEQSSPYLDA